MGLKQRKHRVQSKAWRLIEPYVIKETMIEHEVHSGSVVVKPTFASICHADLRYFTGSRDPNVLAEKLPMALIHEGIGRVEESNDSRIQVGENVVIVPNIPSSLMKRQSCCCHACKTGIGENYCYHSLFIGSGYDGIAQSQLVLPSECVIPIPSEVPEDVAVLTELCTVSFQALRSVREQLNDAKVVVFGDGPVGYLTASMLHHIYGLDKERLTVFGAVEQRLNQFTFTRKELVHSYDFTADPEFDIALECTGGKFSESAVNQAIDLLHRGGHLILMGVSEDKVPINTRDVLEKGLTLHGSSRSSISDYHQVIEAMKDTEYQQTLKKLIPLEKKNVHTAEQFAAELNSAATLKTWEKVMLHFNW